MTTYNFSNLTPKQQNSLTHTTDQNMIDAYQNAKAMVKEYDAHIKALKTVGKTATDKGDGVIFTNHTGKVVAELTTKPTSTASNFKLNIKALYTAWKDADARTALKEYFELTFKPKKGYSAKAIESAEHVAQIAQIEGKAGKARQQDPEVIFDRVKDTYAVSFNTL